MSRAAIRYLVALCTFIVGVSVVAAVWTIMRMRVVRPIIQEQARQTPEQSRLVYVLDSNNGAETAQILLVDAERGEIVKRFPTAYDPEIALAPDGRRIYVEETVRGVDRLSERGIDAGEVMWSVSDPHRVMYKVFPFSHAMAVSADGRWLYLQKYTFTKGAEDAVYWMEIFDTERGEVLPETAPLPKCGVGLIIPSQVKQEVQVLCASRGEVRSLRLSDDGALESVNVFQLPPELAAVTPRLSCPDRLPCPWGIDRIVDACRLRDGQTLLITRFGKLIKIDRDGHINMQSALWEPTENNWIDWHGAVVSPDGECVFVVVGGPAVVNHQTHQVIERQKGEIAVVETETLQSVGSIETSRPVSALEMSLDGGRLYALDWKEAKLMVIDPTTGRELRDIVGLGKTPSLMIAAPLRP